MVLQASYLGGRLSRQIIIRVKQESQIQKRIMRQREDFLL